MKAGFRTFCECAESEVDVEDRIPSSSLQKKQFNGMFVELTGSRLQQLKHFLQNCIVADD